MDRHYKKAPLLAGLYVKQLLSGTLGFGHLARFDGFGADPHALDFTAGELDPDTLQVRAKAALGVFDQRGADTTTLLGETFTNDAAAFNGALACDCADTCHGKFRVEFCKSGRK